MTELICASGHVLDSGRDTCSRCNGEAVNKPVDVTPEVTAEPKKKTGAGKGKGKGGKKAEPSNLI